MRKLTVAVSAGLEKAFESVREIVSVQNADWMEVSAAVLSSSDIEAGRLDEIKAQHLNLPVFVLAEGNQTLSGNSSRLAVLQGARGR